VRERGSKGGGGNNNNNNNSTNRHIPLLCKPYSPFYVFHVLGCLYIYFYPKIYDKHLHTLQKRVQDLDLFLNLVKSLMMA
jgi:hypothetical protein